MILDIFNGKTILITGHTGFKGSWLSIWLHTLGAKVHGYSLEPNTEPNHYTEAHISEFLESECFADLRDRNKLTKYIHNIQPDCVFHLAAQPIVRRSYLEPVETFETNVMGSIFLMEAIRTINKTCTLIMITSDKCYQNVNQIWGYRECDALGGQDPYSSSKAAAEIAIASWRQSFYPPDKYSEHGIHLSSVRAGNVIGGGDWAEDRIIPDAVRAVIAHKTLKIRSPNAVRPWQHVLEPLSGYMLLAARMMTNTECSLPLEDAWNFGPLPTSTTTVRDIITEFYHVWGEGKAEYCIHETKMHEAAVLRLSSEKASILLGWKPIWDLHDTITITAEWYKRFYAGEDAYSLSLANITEYMNKMVDLYE